MLRDVFECARVNPPNAAVERGDDLEFRVWGEAPAYLEDPKPWKLLGAFWYLQEALDYIAYCQDRGSEVALQSPCGCQLYPVGSCRAVYKATA